MLHLSNYQERYDQKSSTREALDPSPLLHDIELIATDLPLLATDIVQECDPEPTGPANTNAVVNLPTQAPAKRGRGRPRKSDSSLVVPILVHNVKVQRELVKVKSEIDLTNIIGDLDTTPSTKSKRSRNVVQRLEYEDFRNAEESDLGKAALYTEEESDVEEVRPTKSRKAQPMLCTAREVFAHRLRSEVDLDEAAFGEFVITEWEKLDSAQQAEYAPLQKRGRGRPRKIPLPKGVMLKAASKFKSKASDSAESMSSDADQSLKRKRGRPRKSDSHSQVAEAESNSSRPYAIPPAIEKDLNEKISHCGIDMIPGDAELVDAILKVLKSDDLENLSVNKVRQLFGIVAFLNNLNTISLQDMLLRIEILPFSVHSREPLGVCSCAPVDITWVDEYPGAFSRFHTLMRRASPCSFCLCIKRSHTLMLQTLIFSYISQESYRATVIEYSGKNRTATHPMMSKSSTRQTTQKRRRSDVLTKLTSSTISRKTDFIDLTLLSETPQTPSPPYSKKLKRDLSDERQSYFDSSKNPKRYHSRKLDDDDTSTSNSSALAYDDSDGHYIIDIGSNLTSRYKMVRLLGQGTFGRVVEAYDRETKTRRAIKIIRSVQKYRDAAKVEIQILNELKHRDPNNLNRCIHLLDYFDYRNHICMENSFKPFPLKHIKAFAFQMLESVKFLHQLRLVHTDLKPENLMIVDSSNYQFRTSSRHNSQRGRELICTDIRLIDFGSAIHSDDHHSSIVSTRHYRAPEIILGLGWSFPCDIWSVGCILVELFTGEALFQTHDNLEHLALMEASLGCFPSSVVHKVSSSAEKYFCFIGSRRGTVRHPGRETSESSIRFVKAMKSLNEMIPGLDRQSKLFLDLTRHLLEYDSKKRMTAVEALEHAFFSSMR